MPPSIPPIATLSTTSLWQSICEGTTFWRMAPPLYCRQSVPEAVAAAKEAIAPLTEATSLDELNAAIAAMDINEGTEASATVYTNQASSAINTYLRGGLPIAPARPVILPA